MSKLTIKIVDIIICQISPEDQIESNFQHLSRAANVAKRRHCNVCKENGKRYDARRLGYKEGWIAGDETHKIALDVIGMTLRNLIFEYPRVLIRRDRELTDFVHV